MIKNEKRLPSNFNEWYMIINERGTTMAHFIARHRCLPPDFDRWYIRNKYGWTVAHEAAGYNYLPLNFNQWGWANDEG
jgi:hypothetical protein